MNRNEEINQYIVQIENALQAIKNLILPPGAKSYKKLPTAESLPTDDLGPIPDFNQEEWPPAILPHLIVNQEDKSARKFRALQVIALTSLTYNDKKILDCGCGDGSIANELSQITNVTGYDIKEDEKWRGYTNNNLLFTTEKTEVEKNRYDIILLYDVIDHIEKENPVFFMQWLKQLLTENGVIFIRTHPWTSIHGGHLYETVNKAYLHLALTPDELSKQSIFVPHNLKLVRPIAAYDLIFEQANLKIEKRKSYTNTVNDFIVNNLLDRIIKITWNGSIDRETALKILSTQFIDYTLI